MNAFDLLGKMRSKGLLGRVPSTKGIDTKGKPDPKVKDPADEDDKDPDIMDLDP